MMTLCARQIFSFSQSPQETGGAEGSQGQEESSPTAPVPPRRLLTRVFYRGNQTVVFGSSSSPNQSSQSMLKWCLWKARIVFLEHIEPDRSDYFPVGRLRPQESPNYSAIFRHLSQPPKGPRSVWLTWAPLLSASQFVEPSGNWTYAPP